MILTVPQRNALAALERALAYWDGPAAASPDGLPGASIDFRCRGRIAGVTSQQVAAQMGASTSASAAGRSLGQLVKAEAAVRVEGMPVSEDSETHVTAWSRSRAMVWNITETGREKLREYGVSEPLPSPSPTINPAIPADCPDAVADECDKAVWVIDNVGRPSLHAVAEALNPGFATMPVAARLPKLAAPVAGDDDDLAGAVEALISSPLIEPHIETRLNRIVSALEPAVEAIAGKRPLDDRHVLVGLAIADSELYACGLDLHLLASSSDR